MLKYTKALIHSTIKDLRKFFFILNVAMQLIYISYLTYTIVAKIGIIYVNAALLSLTAAYFIIFLFLHFKDGKVNRLKSRFRRIYKWTKLSINAFTLGTQIYTIYVTVNNVNALTVTLTVLMAVLWFLQILLEIIIYYCENRKDLFISSLELDFEFVTKPVHTASNLVKRFTGKEETEYRTVPSNVKETLDKMVKNREHGKDK